MRNLFIAAFLLLCLVSAAQAPTNKPAPGEVKVNPKDGLKYVWIPPGTFTMGCSPGDSECGADEEPAHRVTLTKGFWIGQTEVTQAAYQRVKGANPSLLFKGEQRPVANVSWDDAASFCSAVGMRLPTEAEWEYAARAGNTAARYGVLDDIAWHSDNSGRQTHDVGLKQANAWGLYDMLGNVWEWTADWYDLNYYARSEAQDPKGASSGEDRALRGGSWGDNSRFSRASVRGRPLPIMRNFHFGGFRCAGE